MRTILFITALFMAFSVHAYEWDECKFVIEDKNEGAKAADGYRIYIQKDGNFVRSIDVGKSSVTECSVVLTPKDEGEFIAHATAYNEAGESARSLAVPFSVDVISEPPIPDPVYLRIEND